MERSSSLQFQSILIKFLIEQRSSIHTQRFVSSLPPYLNSGYLKLAASKQAGERKQAETLLISRYYPSSNR